MTARPPVEQRIVVRLAPDDAFDLFTRGLARWWPFKGHACSDDAQDVVFDGRVGGAVTEIGADGARHTWGILSEWDPPRSFAMSWHPGQDMARATRLVVRFRAVDSGCEVHLLHGGWEVLGDSAEGTRGNYEQGWGWVLGHFTRLADQEVSR